MSSGPRTTVLTDAVRGVAESAAAGAGVRFDNGEERPLGSKGRRTRSKILRGASRAFSEHGWSATTMATIAQRSQVGTGTTYQYFRRKEDVLAALVGEWTLAALAQLRTWDPAAGREGLRQVVERFVAGYAATAPLQRVWEEVSLVDPDLAKLRDDLTEVYVQVFADAFEAGQAEGILDSGPAPLETARALCAMVDRYCHQVFARGRAGHDVDEVVVLLTDLWAAALRLS